MVFTMSGQQSYKQPRFRKIIPHMKSQNIIDFPHNISVIDTHYYREKCAASHLLINGESAAFVDTGPSPSYRYLLNALAAKGRAPENVRYIILTHIHLDHAGGAGMLMQHCPHAQLVVHPKGLYHMVNPAKLQKATIEIYGKELFERIYQKIVPIPKERAIAAEDGLILDLNGRKLHFLDTPGHARHHCCIWDPESNGIFTGDTMGLAYPELQFDGKPPFLLPTTTPAAFDPAAMKRSISRLVKLKADYYYLTHFGPISANMETVEKLIEMIDKHVTLALDSEHADQLSAQLLNLYHQAYCRYRGGEVDVDDVKRVLAGDITLNSQGLSIWAERVRNGQETAP